MAEKVKAKSGDTLSGIAKAQGTTVAQILKDNPVLKARADAGQTVLFSGTNVNITSPKTATNPYGATTTGTGAGTGTGAVPIGPTGPVNTTTLEGILAASGFTTDATGKIVNPNAAGGKLPFEGDGNMAPDGGGDNPPAGKTVVSTVDNGDGTFTVTYSDGTTAITGTKKVEEAGTTAAEIQALLAQQAAEFQRQMAAMQSGITAQIEAANKAATAAAAQAKIDATNAARKSAFEITKERFANAGMKELGEEITAIYQGTGVDRFGKKFDEIPTTGEGFYLALINTKSYYERFGKVNEDRLAKGFRALDERTIIGMEDEYQQVLQAYNQPAGFYDTPADYQTFLKNNYSKADVASALQASADFVASKDPVIRKELQDLFGIDDAALTAYYADPNKGQKILENIAGKNMNTAAALISGLSREDATIGQQYGAGSFTYEQNRQRYSQASKSLETTGGLAAIYGENFGAKEAIAAEFGDAAAQAQASRIRQTGLAAFGGSSAVGTRALRSTGQVS